jgi:hypothetical protein
MAKQLLSLLFLLVLAAASAKAQSALDNDSIVKMSKAGLSDDVIVSMIKTQPGAYTVNPDAVIQLKTAGLSETIIDAMIEKTTVIPPVAKPAIAAAIPVPFVDEVGVYFKNKDNKWVELLPEVVNWKTGGFLKTLASDGIVKGDTNGHIPGRNSRNVLNTPLDFLIYTPEGVAITEYQLLRLRESGNSREFRSITGV